MIQLMGFAMASSEKQGAMRAHFLKLDNIERETWVLLDQKSVINITTITYYCAY
jgi:hypothetical protein